jgi:hypothetical protein
MGPMIAAATVIGLLRERRACRGNVNCLCLRIAPVAQLSSKAAVFVRGEFRLHLLKLVHGRS